MTDWPYPHSARVWLGWIVAAVAAGLANLGMLAVTGPILEAWLAVPLLAPYWGVLSFVLFAVLTAVAWVAPQAVVVGWILPGRGWRWIRASIIGLGLGGVVALAAFLPVGGLPSTEAQVTHGWEWAVVGILWVSIASLPQAAVIQLQGNTARFWVLANGIAYGVQAVLIPTGGRMEDFYYPSQLPADITRGILLGGVLAYQAGALRVNETARPPAQR